MVREFSLPSSRRLSNKLEISIWPQLSRNFLPRRLDHRRRSCSRGIIRITGESQIECIHESQKVAFRSVCCFWPLGVCDSQSELFFCIENSSDAGLTRPVALPTADYQWHSSFDDNLLDSSCQTCFLFSTSITSIFRRFLFLSDNNVHLCFFINCESYARCTRLALNSPSPDCQQCRSLNSASDLASFFSSLVRLF